MGMGWVADEFRSGLRVFPVALFVFIACLVLRCLDRLRIGQKQGALLAAAGGKQQDRRHRGPQT